MLVCIDTHLFLDTPTDFQEFQSPFSDTNENYFYLLQFVRIEYLGFSCSKEVRVLLTILSNVTWNIQPYLRLKFPGI